MLGWVLTFLVIAMVAAGLGFGGLAAVALDFAKIIFVVGIIFFALSAASSLFRSRAHTREPASRSAADAR